MATNPIENPSVHQELQDAKRKRKQEIDKKYRERKKQKQENNEVQVKTLQGECSYYKGQADFGTKSMTKPFLDEASEIKKLVLGHGEILRHLRDNVNKETAVVYEFWDLIKKTLPGGSTCGSISASTDENGYPPLELSVIAMRSDGSMTTESFKPCQSLPEELGPAGNGGTRAADTCLLWAPRALHGHNSTTCTGAGKMGPRAGELEGRA